MLFLKALTIMLLFYASSYLCEGTCKLRENWYKRKPNQETDFFIKSSKTDNNDMNLQINCFSNNVLQIKLTDATIHRYELPEREPFPYHRGEKVPCTNSDFTYYVARNPFSIQIIRKATAEEIFSTKGFDIKMGPGANYAELTTSLPTRYLFGLGERTTSFLLQSGVYTVYNRDSYGDIEDRKGGKNRYGSHPMYLMREKSGKYHISYLRNAFAFDAIVNHENGVLTYKTSGGVFDFTIFLGDYNPEEVVKSYHRFIGGYSLPPFWSMGFHQCRWGYENLDMLKDVLEKYSLNKLPLDTIWLDIDYMNENMPFTVDEERFNLTQFKEVLDNYKKKFVLIIEPSIGTKWPDYHFYVKGKEMDLYVKNKEGKDLLNMVWPGLCVYLDFFNPRIGEYWAEALDSLHKKLEFSGIWLDMNELAAFQTGQVNESGEKISCNDETIYPYYPGGHPIESNTICANAVHYGGMTQAQIHNYYPVQEQMITFQYLEKKFPDAFPFVLTRAHSVGTGKWSAHWTGDNVGTVDFYRYSVSEVMNNNMFGQPMVGADICGFGDDTEEILCAKWYQMGSLYPFARSHSATGTIRKEPWQMGETLLKTTAKSLNFRYQILKFYYSLFILNGNYGTVFRPVFFNFFTDAEALEPHVIDNEFMIGKQLLVVPNLHSDKTTTHVSAYFPTGQWFDLRYNIKVPLPFNKSGSYMTIDAVLNEMPAVFLRGGFSIFTNTVEEGRVMNSNDLENNFNFLIAFEKSNNTNMYYSSMKIPAIENYNSKNEVTQCINANCFIEVLSTYNPDSLKLTLSISHASSYHQNFTFIRVSSLRFYGGLNIKNLGVSKTNVEEYIETPDELVQLEKFSIEEVNDDFFIIHINGELKISRKDIVIYFQFYEK